MAMSLVLTAAPFTRATLRAGSPLSRNAGEGAERGEAGEGAVSGNFDLFGPL